MSRRMTTDEAIDLIDVVFETSPDGIVTGAAGVVDVTVYDMDVGQARADIESFLAMRPGNVDPASIEIRPDRSDNSDAPMVRVIIKTSGA